MPIPVAMKKTGILGFLPVFLDSCGKTSGKGTGIHPAWIWVFVTVPIMGIYYKSDWKHIKCFPEFIILEVRKL